MTFIFIQNPTNVNEFAHLNDSNDWGGVIGNVKHVFNHTISSSNKST